MIEDWGLSVVVAALAPALAYAAKRAIEVILRNKVKELIVSKEGKAPEILVVEANSSNRQVRSIVRSALAYEEKIDHLLSRIAQMEHLHYTSDARSVDFIIDLPNSAEKIAVEVKLNLNRLGKDDIERYMSAVENIKHLLLISSRDAPPSTREALDPYLKSGKLTLLTVPLDSESVDEVSNAIARAKAASGV
jgi:hypothetical protein